MFVADFAILFTAAICRRLPQRDRTGAFEQPPFETNRSR
jgi:hypothetical protein